MIDNEAAPASATRSVGSMETRPDPRLRKRKSAESPLGGGFENFKRRWEAGAATETIDNSDSRYAVAGGVARSAAMCLSLRFPFCSFSILMRRSGQRFNSECVCFLALVYGAESRWHVQLIAGRCVHHDLRHSIP